MDSKITCHGIFEITFNRIDTKERCIILCLTMFGRFHFFFCNFCPALVVVPAASFLVVLLMTPTATVCLDGMRVTMAASPDLMNLWSSSSWGHP